MNGTFVRFATLCASTYHGPPVPESEQSLCSLESALGILLPKAYRDFMLLVGAVYTPQILDYVVDEESELPSLQDILGPTAAIEETRSWHTAGMPTNLFAFASDSSGNKLCFEMASCVAPRPNDLPVHFFDHDFDSVELISPTFTGLLSDYVALAEKAR
jgi:hypothetical protein